MDTTLLPNVNFSYNFAYDLIFKELFEAKKKANKITFLAWKDINTYPSKEETKAKKQELSLRRDQNWKNVLGIISENLCIGWNQKKISCLCIGYCHLFGALALPLTVNTHYPLGIDFLGSVAVSHEMIHLIQQQNKEIHQEYVRTIHNKYKIWEQLCTHSLVFAVQYDLLKKMDRVSYIDKLKEHYQWKEELSILEFIDNNGPYVMLNTFQDIVKAHPRC